MEIRSKRKFYEMWQAGLLGNRTMLWHELSEIPPSIKRVGFRAMGAGGGAWTLVERSEAKKTFDEWKAAGRRFIMDGSVPNNRALMQGEVCRTEYGLEGFLCEQSHAQVFEGDYIPPGLPPMRVTMARGWHRHLSYLQTRIMLDRYLDPSSRDDLDALLELYPDAAVELTAFDCHVGTFPRRNTIFWEVRNY